MDTTEVRALLSAIVTGKIDPFFRTFSAEEASAMTEGWASMLAAVPLDFAVAEMRRHYSVAGAHSLTPGDLLSGWHAVEGRRRTEEAQAEDRAERERTYRSTGDRQPTPASPPARRLVAEGAPPERLGLNAKPGWYDAQVAAYAAAGLDAASVPLPFIPQPVGAEERRERRCRHWHGCACDHTSCRDGWLDGEQVIYSKFGDHPATVPCAACHDAALMAAESAPKSKKRNRVR